MNVNFEYYKIFYYVAKYRNFTKAAQALENSQPNITRAMNCLEQQIHTTLFVRTNRGVQLTPEGEKLYTHVSAAMVQLMTAEEELTDSTGLSHGSIAIGASETALNIFLLDKLKAFHMKYPGIRLKIYNHSTPEAIEAVKSGKIDFAVVSTPAAAFSRNFSRWNDIYGIRKSGTLIRRTEELPFDMSWKRNYDISVLQQSVSISWTGTDAGYGDCDNRSDSSIGKM